MILLPALAVIAALAVKLAGMTGYTAKVEDKTYPMAKNVQVYLKQDSAYYCPASTPQATA